MSINEPSIKRTSADMTINYFSIIAEGDVIPQCIDTSITMSIHVSITIHVDLEYLRLDDLESMRSP